MKSFKSLLRELARFVSRLFLRSISIYPTNESGEFTGCLLSLISIAIGVGVGIVNQQPMYLLPIFAIVGYLIGWVMVGLAYVGFTLLRRLGSLADRGLSSLQKFAFTERKSKEEYDLAYDKQTEKPDVEISDEIIDYLDYEDEVNHLNGKK